MNKEIEDYLNLTFQIKSSIITITTRIEYLIELTLASKFTFTKKEYIKFSKIFFNNENEVTFSVKIKMFENFLIEYYPEFLKKNPDFIKSLNRVRRLRNTFAHSVDPARKELEDFAKKQSHMILSYVENGEIKKRVFSFKEIEQRISDCEKINSSILPIFEYIEKQKKIKIK